MKSHLVIAAVCAITCSADASTIIREYSGHYQLNVDYSIASDGSGNNIGVRIHKNSVQSILWRFEAYDSVSGDPRDINFIEIPPTGTVGWVALRIYGDGRPYGARHVKKIDLVTNADSSGQVHSMTISGDYGQTGPMLATFVSGISIGGNCVNGILPTSLSGQVSIQGNLTGTIHATGAITADVTVSGAGPHTGSIASDSSAEAYGGTIYVGGSMSGNVTFGDGLSGSVTIDGAMSGNTTINGDLTGALAIGGDLSGYLSIKKTLTGTVSIDGDVLDGANYIDIRQRMNGGHFSCRDLNLKAASGGDWFVLGRDIADSAVKTIDNTGTIDVTGTLRGRIRVKGKSSLTINVATLDADLDGTTGYLEGGIEPHFGFGPDSDITIGSFVRGRIAMQPQLYPQIESETIPFNGAMHVAGVMGANAKISTENTKSTGGTKPIDIGAEITIDGDPSPTNHTGLAGTIRTTGDLTGRVRINESLNATGHVIVDGDINGSAAVTVDYDGWQSADDWISGGDVKVNSTTYTRTTPGKHIWEVTECRGDMNNDGSVNGYDIAPFVAALGDPNGYAIGQYAGLEGSMVFHGDCNGNGSFNGQDIAPFVERVQALCCSAGSCGGFAPRGAPDGAAIGTLFRDNLSPYWNSALSQIVASMRDALDGLPEEQFWSEMYVALTE